MSDIDLDITNYSIGDLEKFFSLDPKQNYTSGDIELREYEIREQLLSSGHVKRKFKKELIDFLAKAKQLLSSKKTGMIEANPSKSAQAHSEYKEIESASRAENELITRPDKKFTYSYPSEYYPGQLNPLDTRTITKYVSIDTRFRDNYETTSASDFTIQLPSRLNKVVSMQLSSLEFTITCYSISAKYGNNFLYMYADTQYYEGGPITPYEKVIIIPDGNYNATDLLIKINSLLSPTDTEGALLEPDSVFSYIKFYIDINENSSGSGRLYVGPNAEYPESNIVHSIGLDFTKSISCCADDSPITTRIGWNLGFTKPKYLGSNAYTSDTVMDLSIMRYVYLGIDDYQRSANRLFFNAFHDKHISENVLARVALQSNSFAVLVANNLGIVTEPRKYFGPVDIQRLRIQLYDDHGRPLGLNHANYSFVLTFKMLYDL
ncbi:MAG: hypothetical protein ACOVRN_09440 [Flavobacterium sp.]